MNKEDIRYLCYRCYICGRLITKLDLVRVWTAAEKAGVDQKSVCPCGSGKLSPTNPKLWEELLLPRVWRLWLQEVVWPWVKGKR